MSSSLHLDTGNGHQCQRKRNCSFLSYHYRGLMSSWRCWVSHFWQEFNISIISLLTNLCWQVEIWFFLISNWNSANFDCTFCYWLLDCVLYVQLAKYKKKKMQWNTPGVCCFSLMLLTWAICLWNTALQVISIKVNNSPCTMAATYSIKATNACGFVIHPWQWQMFESFSHCHTVRGIDKYILINKSSSC